MTPAITLAAAFVLFCLAVIFLRLDLDMEV